MSHVELIYTVSQKNRANLYSCITSAYVDRFSKFFHCWIQQGICSKTLVMFPTTGYICCYTALGDVLFIFISFFTLYTLRFVKVLLKFYWLIDWLMSKLYHFPDQSSFTKTYSVIDETIGEWRKRLRACVRAKGGHFEHLIWLMRTETLTSVWLMLWK